MLEQAVIFTTGLIKRLPLKNLSTQEVQYKDVLNTLLNIQSKIIEKRLHYVQKPMFLLMLTIYGKEFSMK